MWAAVGALKAKAPLVHCLTNYVSMDIMANGLLAIGASPAMVHSTDELADAVPIVGAIGGAVCVNIGTLDDRWIESFKMAVELCKEHKVPWILDPVAAGFTNLRTATALELMQIHPPTVIRGNGSEIAALAPASEAGGTSKGVDSTEASDAALGAAKRIARQYPETVVCISGEVDYVVSSTGDGFLVSTNPHGTPMLTKVTATGCLLNSLIAAFVASRPADISAHQVTVLCATYLARCAEIAASEARGPASFRTALIDRLYSLTEEACGEIRTELDANL